jgi:predicted CopG family antitoxin
MSSVQRYAVLMGNSDLSPDRDYLGFDGEPMNIDFNDSEQFSNFIRRRTKRKRRGSRFLEGLGISPEASRERRSLKRQKQQLAERQQRDSSKADIQNLKLQEQAIKQSATAPTGEDELKAILSQSNQSLPVSVAEQGFWKSLKGWQKGAIIGGGLLVVGIGGYLIYKATKK